MSARTAEPWPRFHEAFRIAPERPGAAYHKLYEDDYNHARTCVNACAGINPEAVPDLLAAARAAFEAMKRWESDIAVCETGEALRAAIASAKGE